ncbi:aspartyl-tRNA(Asn)/glutamyl-tRNA(Gln) amidotransferase subunit A [Actinoplanes lutulentus]|uniref:Aspartyl-tRNA(Asn)/glutamyl-tRNA(Gln) amidotransferase subunit A n=1 Tax=Actinoplanes lutulentus TaxID=1287878 RepID=A0A327ZFL8_9ACTN|nr:amidase [Actinoplanes lutulentus]MBB2946785.1 aspartyl-tRNA(Asn)/glutamyl-tRNA(Gln) amidotransferase subunit A [Actinoplanes lutulentus]RAK35677.1 aspartyl-tRNA(Asn)/glutamyl-tRNA(Gln) amidotransferase subunit A [Actinoplanes lutulentus]
MTAVNRRVFLARTAAITAAAATGAAALPAAAQAWSGKSPKFGDDAYVAPRAEARKDLTELTVAEAAWMIRFGKLKPAAIVEAYLARIGSYDAVYQAFNTVLTDDAIKAAVAAGKKKQATPLHGIPLAIKDNYWTKGVRTTANSYLFQDFVPPYDATAVAKLKSAGAIVLGKTQMGPLATTRATTPAGKITTVNAWTPANPATDPGGSSTGTATSVASRMAASGTGTQTGGSITAPSNAQNLTGLKPTMGRVSLAGIIPLSYTRDHPGPLARDAKDAAIMLTAMAGEDPADPRTQGLPALPDLIAAATPVVSKGKCRVRKRVRVGVLPGYASTTTRTAFLSTLDTIDGISLVDVPFPDQWDLLTGNEFNNVRLPERSEPFMPYLRNDLRGFGVSVTGWLQGALLGANEFITGQRAKLLLLERVLDQVFEKCDVVVQTSPVPFDILGLPEIGFPIGFSAAGVPIGTILGGAPYEEDQLLSVVAAYQAVTDWHWKRPADPATPAAAARSLKTTDDRGTLTAEDVLEQMQ